MNTIKQLIDKYCPDGVEYKKLGEVCKTIPAPFKVKTSQYLKKGKYAIIDQGQSKIAGYTNDEFILIPKGEYVLYGDHTCTVKYVNFRFAQGADGLKILKTEQLLTKYLYYALSNFNIENNEYKRHWSIVKEIYIPVPPISVQREIVRILDNFTSLEAELEAELEARRKQYEYYRDQLLSFNYLNREDKKEVEWKTLGEVFEMRNGYTPSKSHSDYWEGGTIPWFRMEDIRTCGRKLSDSILHITEKGIKGKGLFEKGTFILATTATIGEHALLIVDSLANQQFTNLKIRKLLTSSLSVDFVFYYMFVVDEFCKKHTNKSGFESVDMKALNKMPFPIPPLSTQHRIVSILDRFESLVNNITSGLPAEIAARHQQYEYYRDQLLTFKRKS